MASGTFAAGKQAYVTVNDDEKTFDEWAMDLASDKADVSNFDRQSALWIAGLPTGNVSLSGPYSVQALGMLPGLEYDVVLGVTPLYGIVVTVLVEHVRPKAQVKGVVRVEVTGVVNSDFLIEPTIVSL